MRFPYLLLLCLEACQGVFRAGFWIPNEVKTGLLDYVVLITDSLGLSGMPEGEESSLTSLWLPGAQQQRKLLVTGVLATVLTMAEMYNGSVTRLLRYIKRYAVLQFAS